MPVHKGMWARAASVKIFLILCGEVLPASSASPDKIGALRHAPQSALLTAASKDPPDTQVAQRPPFL